MENVVHNVNRKGKHAHTYPVVENPIRVNVDGKATWTPKEGDTYLFVGYDIAGHYFEVHSDSWLEIDNTVCSRGHKYLVRNGRRFMITPVHGRRSA